MPENASQGEHEAVADRAPGTALDHLAGLDATAQDRVAAARAEADDTLNQAREKARATIEAARDEAAAEADEIVQAARNETVEDEHRRLPETLRVPDEPSEEALEAAAQAVFDWVSGGGELQVSTESQ